MEGISGINKGNINLEFNWQGKTAKELTGKVESIRLGFPGSATSFNVKLPVVTDQDFSQNFRFTCYKPEGITSTPKHLSVKIETVRGLCVFFNFIPKITSLATECRADLFLPKEMEPNHTYTLIVRANFYDPLSNKAFNPHSRLVSATLVKKIAEAASPGEGGGGSSAQAKAAFSRNLNEFGTSVIETGMKNLTQALAADVPNDPLDELLTAALREIIEAGQVMHQEIRVPLRQKAPLTDSDILLMSTAHLKLLFEKTFIQDKQYEINRAKAALSGNIQEMNKITAEELKNSQLLIKISQGLERRGVTPLIPDSEEFKTLSREAKRLQEELIKKFKLT